MKRQTLSPVARYALLGALGLVSVCLVFGIILGNTAVTEAPHTLDTGGLTDLSGAENGTSMLLNGTENGEYFAANYFPTLLGAKSDDGKDDTAPLREALEMASATGGTVYLPAGTYRISEPLTVPAGVTLRGDFTPPDAARSRRTVFSVPDGDTVRSAPLLTVEEGACLMGITVYYETQNPQSPVEYPATVFCTQSCTVERLALINPYHGICISGGEEVRVSAVWMSPLDYGVLVTDNEKRVVLEDISISPIYWLNSVPSTFSAEGSYKAMTEYLSQRLHGIILEKVADVAINRYTMDDGAVGLLLNIPLDSEARPLISECSVSSVTRPLSLKSLSAAGACFADCTFRPDSDVGATTVVLENTVQSPVIFSACSFAGSPKTVISGQNPSLVSFYYCDFGTWWNTCFDLSDSTFLALLPSFHTGEDKAILGKNAFGLLYGAEALDDSSELLFSVTEENAMLSGTLSVRARKDAAEPLPNKTVFASDFGVSPQNEDNSEALAAAFEALGAEGGIVFLSEGEYRFRSPVIIPPSVRLIGVGDGPSAYKTSLVFPSEWQGSVGLILLQENAGAEHLEIRGPESGRQYALYSTASGVRVHHVSLTCSLGIGLTESTASVLEHLNLRCTTLGIELRDCNEISLRNITFTDTSEQQTMIGLRCENTEAFASLLFADRLFTAVECDGESVLSGTQLFFCQEQGGLLCGEKAKVQLSVLALEGIGEGGNPYFVKNEGGEVVLQGALLTGSSDNGTILFSQGGSSSLRAAVLAAKASVSVYSQGTGTVSVSGCIWNADPLQHALIESGGTLSVNGNLLLSEQTFEGIEGAYLRYTAEEGATVNAGGNVIPYRYVEGESGGSESGTGADDSSNASPSGGGHEPIE